MQYELVGLSKEQEEKKKQTTPKTPTLQEKEQSKTASKKKQEKREKRKEKRKEVILLSNLKERRKEKATISHHPKQIPTNSSRLMAPSPSRSNSSIIATNSSSCNPSPNSLATLLKSCKLILPLPSASNRSKARRISSWGFLLAMRFAATETKAA
jgi:hypothetical protein